MSAPEIKPPRVSRPEWSQNVACDSKLSPRAARLGAIIALKYINEESGLAWPSQGSLAKDLGLNETSGVRTVRVLVAELTRAGYLGLEQGGGNKSTVYWLTEPDGGFQYTTPRRDASESTHQSAQTVHKREDAGIRGGGRRHPGREDAGIRGGRMQASGEGGRRHPPNLPMNIPSEPCRRAHTRDDGPCEAVDAREAHRASERREALRCARWRLSQGLPLEVQHGFSDDVVKEAKRLGPLPPIDASAVGTIVRLAA